MQCYCPASQSSSRLRCGSWLGHNTFALFAHQTELVTDGSVGPTTYLSTFLTACRWYVEYTGRNFWSSSISLTAKRTAHSELIALLIGVAVLWSYIGWILDTRNAAPRPKSLLRSIAGAVGLLFGIFLLVATMPMFHVGLIYKAVTLVWVFMICRHFLLFFRNSPADSRYTKLV